MLRIAPHGTLLANRHDHLGADAKFPQVARQAIGAGIQLPVSDALRTMDQRNRIGRPPGCRFDEMVDAPERRFGYDRRHDPRLTSDGLWHQT